MADNNENFRLSKSETELFIEQLKQPQDWSETKVQKKFEELGFDFPTNEEQLKQFDEKFKNYPHKLTGREIDPIKIINSIKQ